ncbi:MAG: hypothetical protein J6U87_05820, partial [Clostridia bacterium]|nr:hypothetical protein [Clostridia bacterium]
MQASYEETKEGEARWERRAEEALVYLLFAALGALFSGATLLFGVRPFGIALCAVAAGKLFSATLLGAAVFSLWQGDYLTLLALMALVVCRVILPPLTQRTGERPPAFSERAGARVLAAALASFFLGSVALFRGEMKTYYLLALLLGVSVSALAAWLLCGFFSPRDALFPYSREAGLGAMVLLGI